MFSFLEKVNSAVWGVPLIILIAGTGLYLSVRTGFVQFRLLPEALNAFFRQFGKKEEAEGVSPYRALCTALAATVGTGNLAGVAGAIAIGGPGAVFWMWVCALLGMVTKFAEATLAVQYQDRNKKGELVGGPMYIIQKGLTKKWHWMAGVYCFFGVVASFGVGNATQVNTVIGGISSVVSVFGGELSRRDSLLIGIGLAALIGVLFLGGARRVGQVAETLVPLMAAAYLLLCVYVLFSRADRIGPAFQQILMGAFTPKAVTGGAVGSVFVALRIGAARGVFTNEAGMGTAAIAHGSARVSRPAEQGLMGILEVFLDTVVICTMTALVILCSGVPIPYGVDTGIQLTQRAFTAVCGEWISVPIAASLCCFAIATILGWGLYGIRCAQYLFGESVWKRFVALQIITTVAGAVLQTGTVWMLADIVNGLMAVPNLITLILLTPELQHLTRQLGSRPRKWNHPKAALR